MRENLRRGPSAKASPKNQPGGQFRWAILEADAGGFGGATITRRIEDSVENSVRRLRYFLMTEAL
jgi:hypothetical protein